MKKSTLSLFFSLLSLFSYCQEIDSSFFFTKIPVHAKPIDKPTSFSTNNYLPTIIPPSPNAASWSKYGEIPVNLSSGLPNVPIPMYSLNERKLKLNIGLDYNYSGFKPYEQVNLLGRGWTLKCGGVISRLQKDILDEKNVNGITGYSIAANTTSISQLLTQDGHLNCTGNNCPSCFAYRQCDGEPDIFYFSIGDFSGKFFFGEDGQIHVVSDRKVKIAYQKFTTSVPIYNGEFTNIYGFTLTTEDGTIYRFGDPATSLSEIVDTRRNVEFSWGYSTFSNLCEGCYSSSISAWYLREIESSEGDKITFEYTNDYRTATNDPASNRTRLTSSPYQHSISASDGSLFSEENVYNYSFSTENLLTKIKASNWDVVLTYNDLANGNLHTLKDISLNTKSNTLAKKYQFSYTGQNIRTLLDKVTEVSSDLTENPPYQFQYYSSFPTTLTSAFAIDYFGYYNENQNTSLVPVYPYYANRNPKFSSTLIGALQRITYPTQGATEIVYEQNEYSFLRNSPSVNGSNIGRQPHGGLRIKQITDYSEGTTIAKSRKYYYSKFDDSSRSSGIISAPLNFNELNIVSTQSGGLGPPWNQVPNVNVTYSIFSSEPYYSLSVLPVYYFNVKEEEVGNGYTEHTFTSHFDYNDILGVNYGYATNLVGPVGSYDFARYMPKLTKTYDINGNLLKEKIIEYQLSDSHTARTLWRQQILTTDGGSFQFAKGLKTISGWFRKILETDKDYSGTVAFERKSLYNYNSNLQVYKQTSTEAKSSPIVYSPSYSADSRVIETYFSYPADFPNDAVLNAMVTRNMISPIIEKRSQLYDNESNQVLSDISYEKTTYNQFGTLYLPSKIETKIGSGTLITPITFNTYDTRGNLTKYTTRTGQIATMTYYGTTDIGKIDLLKTQTIGGGSTGTVLSRSTSYDYFPLIGLSSATDINGYTLTYQYDSFSRLKSVKDSQSYLLKDFNYHYANQAALTGLGVVPTNAMNYVISRTAREAQTGTSLSSTVENTTTAIQYSDGLARGVQSQIWKGSPDQTKDIITQTTLFDAYGRANKAILATPSDLVTGGYKSTALALAQAFYADNSPNTETVFEASPLNRPVKEYGVGQAWRTADKYLFYQYLLAGNGITRFDVTTDSTVTCNNSYPASSLLNNCVSSEQGTQTYELIDKQGRVTHKYQQMESGFAITGYVYDEANEGRLAYVIPPETYKKLGPGLIENFKKSQDIFKEGIFSYAYDGIGNVIEKHIPGGGITRYVLDKYDRVVLENDDKDSTNLWKMTQYDALGRPILKGILTNIGAATRQTVQNNFDNFGNVSTNYAYEDRGTDLLGYTNRSFPTAYPVSDANIRQVIYYDDYTTWQADVNYNFNAANAFHAQGLAKGLMTGQLKRNLKTGAWEKFVYYYDYRGKLIQEFYLSNRGNIIRKDYQYRFNGELLKVRIEKRSGANVISTKILTYQYDHLGRKVKYNHFLNGTDKSIATYGYDDIGRLNKKSFSPISVINSLQTGSWNATTTWIGSNIPTLSDNVTINTGHTVTINTGEAGSAGSLFDKGKLTNNGSFYLGSLKPATTATELHSLNYKYHIRGLRGINLDDNNNLRNTLFSFKLTYEEDNTYYDNNIRNQYWKSSIDGIQRAYQYTYDKASRLIGAAYGSGKAGEDYALNSVSYDDNGNIKTLSRNGATNSNYTAFGNVDNLTYTYQTNSNKLQKIADATTSNADLGDFRDASNTDNDYTYWQDGSLKKDKNKKIASITYNYLKLPEVITFENARTITTEYDAGGTKLKKIDSNGETTDYEEDEIYVNGNLYQTSHDEGRIANGIYEYNITDHNNDLRVSFRDSLGIAVPTQSIFYDPWGLSMKGMAITRNPTNFNKYQFLNRETQFETGYIDLIHRQFDPQIGRFTSQDPVIDGQEHLSLYQYGWNNPILKPDPDGLMPDGDDDAHSEFFLARLVVTAFFDVKHAVFNTAARVAGSDLRASYSTNSDGQEVFETKYEKVSSPTTLKGVGKEILSSGLDAMVASGVKTGVSGVGLVAESSETQTARGVRAVVSTGTTQSRAGKAFTPSEKAKVISANAAKNDGKIVCEGCGVTTTKPAKSTKGVTPPKTDRQIDHKVAKSKGGSGTADNGQVLCRDCNRAKSDN